MACSTGTSSRVRRFISSTSSTPTPENPDEVAGAAGMAAALNKLHRDK
jgi:hypothetical protein